MQTSRLQRSLVAVVMLFALLVQGTWVLAGTTGQITGLLTDPATKAPIRGAQVTAASPSQSAVTTTDAGGRFTFLSLAPDTYAVTVSVQGYEPQTASGITVVADGSQTVNLSVSRATATIGRTTSRSPSDLVRPGTTQNVYSVSGAAQDTVAALGGGNNQNSAYSAIASVPGVVVPYGGAGIGQTLFIHGSSYAQIGYEFDGVPVNRAFDNYNGNSLANLGQQELQVVTSGSNASSSSATVAGFINQVIRTGTYPGFTELNVGTGGPAFYHKLSFETGGATQNRNFSYYLGLSGYNQDFRYGDQYNGGTEFVPGFPALSSPGYTTNVSNNTVGVFPFCVVNNTSATSPFALAAGAPGAIPVGSGGDPGCIFRSQYDLGGVSSVADRETVVNLHFGIPKKDGSKDDIQLLYDGSYFLTKFYSSVNDYGGPAALSARSNGAFSNVSYQDGYTFAPGTQFGQPAGSAVASPYYFPSSNPHQFRGTIDPSLRDGEANNTGIFKVQYQHNMGNAYIRVYGYSLYSDWLQNAPTGAALAYVQGTYSVLPVSRDYELVTHTRGGEIQFADQINSTNQILATANFTTASVSRTNNGTSSDGLTTAGTNLTDGTNCYNYQTGAAASCYSSSTYGTFGSPIPDGNNGTKAYNPAALAGTPGANANFLVTNTGPVGTYNTVKPNFTSFSLTDDFRPNSKLVINGGVRVESFQYNLSDTSSPDYKLWFNQVANTYCYDLKTGQPLLSKAPPNGVGGSAPLVTGFGNTCGVAAGPGQASPTGRVDSATGDPVGNPNGQFGTINYSNIGFGQLTKTVFEPRIGATFTVNPDTALRFSAGLYSEPFNTATVQYLNLAPRTAATFDFQNFFGYGFNSPDHSFDPSKSYNFDFSLEKRLHGTDVSFKLSPFYRYIKNQYQDFLIGPGFVSSIPTGNETAYGVEFQIRKGDPSRDGLSEQLSYTYTNGFMKFNRLSNGSTVVTPVNGTIDAYNALTSTGNRSGAKGAPCYIGGAPCPAGDYTLNGTTVNLTPAALAAGDVINPYYFQPAQPYLNETGPYPVYQTFPSANGAGGGVDQDETILEPHAFSGFVNYRHKRFDVAIAGTMTVGNPSSAGFARYGSPYTSVGVDPRTCSANQSNVPTATNPGQPNYISCGPSLAQFGALYIPNPQTGQFDGFGAYQNPWLLNINAALAYDITPKVRAKLTLANVFNRCFGGSTAPWTSIYSPGGQTCGYAANPYYASNFYNGSSPQDAAANGIAAPKYSTPSYAPTSAFLPFSVYLNFSFKL